MPWPLNIQQLTLNSYNINSCMYTWLFKILRYYCPALPPTFLFLSLFHLLLTISLVFLLPILITFTCYIIRFFCCCCSQVLLSKLKANNEHFLYYDSEQSHYSVKKGTSMSQNCISFSPAIIPVPLKRESSQASWSNESPLCTSSSMFDTSQLALYLDHDFLVELLIFLGFPG